MCRIFGFRSIFENRVHSSLINAENALVNLSRKHKDGWGVAYYLDDIPHLIKSSEQAFEDHIFEKVSGVVTSKSVIAHIRYATAGSSSILNSHPFQYGKWTFAHNGNIKNYETYKSKLMSLVHLDHQKYILGNTDSEIIFHIILTDLKKNLLYNTVASASSLIDSIKNSLSKICSIIGDLTDRDDAMPTDSYLTFVLSNGPIFIAVQGGQPLYYSTHKNLCPDRESCSYYDRSCENKSSSATKVNHLIISSEKLEGQNTWSKLNFGDIVIIDNDMMFYKENLKLPLMKL